jgi:hypothetical protein
MGKKLETLEKCVGTGYRIGTRKSVGTNQRQGDVFLGIEMREEIAVLKDEPEAAAIDAEIGFICGEWLAIDKDLSFLWDFETCKKSE